MRNFHWLIVAVFAWASLIQTPVAFAAEPVKVEVIALAHWPVQKALKPVRDIFPAYKGTIRVVELDADSKDGIERLKSVGLKGHIPVLVLVDGKYNFTADDGKKIELLGFPSGESNPLGTSGTWSPEDLNFILATKVK